MVILLFLIGLRILILNLYSELAINDASENGHIAVLDWFQDYGL